MNWMLIIKLVSLVITIWYGLSVLSVFIALVRGKAAECTATVLGIFSSALVVFMYLQGLI